MQIKIYKHTEMNKCNIVDKEESSKKWNDDRIDINKFNETGIAELGRVYDDLPAHDKFDHSITQLPIVAKGITAFLSHTSLDSYRCIITGFGINQGLGLKVFFDRYYSQCLKFLRQYDRNSKGFDFEWKTEKQLAIEHLENEKTILSEPPLFYSEFCEMTKDGINVHNENVFGNEIDCIDAAIACPVNVIQIDE
jgi:hypothetical protein